MLQILLDKTKSYVGEILSRKKCIMASAIVFITLFLVSFFYLYEGAINKRFILFSGLCLMTASFLVLPKIKNIYLSLACSAFYLVLLSRKMFQRMELPTHDMSSLMDGAEKVNVLLILLIYAILLLIFQNVGVAFGTGSILLGVFTVINYYVVLEQKMAAMLVTDEYRFTVNAEFWYSILYFLFFISFGFWCNCKLENRKMFHTAVTAISVTYLIGFSCFWFGSDYLEEKQLRKICYFPSLNQQYKGLLLSNVLTMPEDYEEAPWYDKSTTICHALGATEDDTRLTNSLEALTYNYKIGHRVFEVDIQITSDDVAVLRHDWVSDLGQADDFGWTESVKEVPTSEQFLNAPIYEKFTPMTLLDLYDFMDRNSEVYMVLDPKVTDDVRKQFSIIVNTALDNGYESVLDRVVVQLYDEEMYDETKSIYPFKNYIYTLYMIGYTQTGKEEEFCVEKGIPVLVMPYEWMGELTGERIARYNLKNYVHTVNEMSDAHRMANVGVDGIYTDLILPYQFESMK